MLPTSRGEHKGLTVSFLADLSPTKTSSPCSPLVSFKLQFDVNFHWPVSFTCSILKLFTGFFSPMNVIFIDPKWLQLAVDVTVSLDSWLLGLVTTNQSGQQTDRSTAGHLLQFHFHVELTKLFLAGLILTRSQGSGVPCSSLTKSRKASSLLPAVDTSQGLEPKQLYPSWWPPFIWWEKEWEKSEHSTKDTCFSRACALWHPFQC